MSKVLCAALISLGVVALTMPVQASPVQPQTPTCSTTSGANTPLPKDALLTNIGCLDGNGANDTNAVNGYFGVTNWVQDAKDNGFDGTDTGANLFGLVVTGDTKGGFWAFNPAALAGKVMLVLKGGNNNTPSWFAYLVNTASGSYASPFFNQNNQQQGLSHMSLYVQATTPPPAPVPLPAAGLMLLTGAGSLVAFSRRRKTRSDA